MKLKLLLVLLVCCVFAVVFLSQDNSAGTVSGAIIISAGLLIVGLSKEDFNEEE